MLVHFEKCLQYKSLFKADLNSAKFDRRGAENQAKLHSTQVFWITIYKYGTLHITTHFTIFGYFGCTIQGLTVLVGKI